VFDEVDGVVVIGEDEEDVRVGNWEEAVNDWVAMLVEVVTGEEVLVVEV